MFNTGTKANAPFQEAVTADFERKRKEAEEIAEAKTAKNRAKRQKKKERAKGKGAGPEATAPTNEDRPEAPIKKRRLISGKEIVFRKPGQDSEGEDIGPELPPEEREGSSQEEDATASPSLPLAEIPRIVIHEEE